jgi:redox-sensing transcriptional repressor
MLLDYCGTPTKGYNVQELEYQIGELLDDPFGQTVAVVGLGNLGTSLIDYCWWRYQNLAGIFGFDHDHKQIKKSSKFGKCYHIDSLEEIIKKENINIAIISVPPDEAQNVANRLIAAGVKGILNYTPARLNLPDNVYVEDVDLLLALDKVAFLARNHDGMHKKSKLNKS